MKTKNIETTVGDRSYVLLPWIAPHNKLDRAGVGCAARTCGDSLCRALGPCAPRTWAPQLNDKHLLKGLHVWVDKETFDYRGPRGLLADYGYGEATSWKT